MTLRLAVLASGAGSNLQALCEHFAAPAGQRSGDIVLVASDREDAGALRRAADWHIASRALNALERTAGLRGVLAEHAIDAIVLAGYLRLVPAEVTTLFRGRVLNVHPALLPAFGGAGMYGARVHAAVLASGATVTGATVHFVDDVFDRGPIIAQWPVPVLAADTPASLAARVLEVEHVLYPRVVQAFCEGRVRLADDGRVEGRAMRMAAAGFTLTADAAATRVALLATLERPASAPDTSP